MKHLSCLIGLMLIPSPVSAYDPPSDWVSLFNGKDLFGWTPKFAGVPVGENYKNTFRVTDGKISVNYDEYQTFDAKFGHLFFDQPFKAFHLRLEYRIFGEQLPGAPVWAYRNSGVMLHSQSPESMEFDQSFPVSLEMQFLAQSDAGDRYTGNLCTPGTNVFKEGQLHTRHCTPSLSRAKELGAWVKAEMVVAPDGTTKHYINGEEVFSYSTPMLDPSDKFSKALIKDGNLNLDGGYIALQAESHPVEFRNIEIKVLSTQN